MTTFPRSFRTGAAEKLATPGFTQGLFVAFIALTFLLGGGSRQDIVSLVVLRPLAFLVIAYCALVCRRDDLRAVRVPFVLLLCLIGLLALQLIPLPPGLWRHLPDREIFARIYQTAGIDLPWLPLAMSPARALNALMALSVPLAGLLLFAVQSPQRRSMLYRVVWIAAICSLLLGMLQLAGSPRGPFYLYRITNNGLPVGLFANRNHQALLIDVGIVLAATLLARGRTRGRPSGLSSTLAVGSIFLFVPFLLITGSRAGLLIGAAMLLPASLIIYLGFLLRSGTRGRPISPAVLRGALIGGAATLGGLFVAAVVFSRSLAFDRLVDSGARSELRIDVLPSLVQLFRTELPFGIGFGSFEFAYKRIEPTNMLMPTYLNQAHNDWLQVAIEGGVPAILLLAVFIGWFAKAAFSVLRTWRQAPDFNALASIAVVLAFATASLVDYPLRVPSLMLVFALACGILSDRQRPE